MMNETSEFVGYHPEGSEVARFPDISIERDTDANPAVRAFGRRFYRDQTPLEYLAEFLLCFNAEKELPSGARHAGLPVLDAVPRERLVYHPESRLALKLFSFFPSSKLETRHPAHVERFKQLVADIGDAVDADQAADKKQAVRVLQQLFAGFVGVAGQRTWVTHSFIPASRYLLSREIDWRHTKAVGDNVSSWSDAQNYFSVGSHNFMARGGEVLFLQLWHVLRAVAGRDVEAWLAEQYPHIAWQSVGDGLVTGLEQLVGAIDAPLATLGSVVERAARQEPAIQEKRGGQRFGWVPRDSWQEAALFAWEVTNVTSSQQDPLRKVRVLQDLCCLHVLRSLCFQAVRLVDPASGEAAASFAGGYAWITVGPQARPGTDLGKASVASVSATEELLYKAVRSAAVPALAGVELLPEAQADKADQHGYKLFRSLAKHIGLMVPRKGPMPRFTLSSSLVETAVAALLRPGERVPLDEFLSRLYRHFGIAVGTAQIEAALPTLNSGVRLAPQNDCAAWLEEELKRGGFLIPLSDATPLVANPA